MVRKEKYELPPEAIREMIINAHCHRNLLDQSCIQIAIYDDRLEATSPGGLYNGLTYEEVMNGHSKIRNPYPMTDDKEKHRGNIGETEESRFQ